MEADGEEEEYSSEEMGSDEDEDLDDDYDSDDEDAELDNISMSELEEMAASTARSLFMVQMQVATQQAAEDAEQIDVDHRSPQERWQEFMRNLPQGKVLKIMDTDIKDMGMDESQQQNAVIGELIGAVLQHKGLTHVILGGAFLRAFQGHQRNLYEAVWSKHFLTLTYLKLGSEECDPAIMDFSGLLNVLKTLRQPTQEDCRDLNLTELELVSFSIQHQEDIISLKTILSHANKLKQLNLLGIRIDKDIQAPGLVDPLLQTAAGIKSLDECRVSCTEPASGTLLSPYCLVELFSLKQKWWRLGLDGMGLDNEHCQIIAQAMTQEACKAGDLLSLTLNPAITHQGFNKLFSVLFQKQRMGLVKVDDNYWQSNFDLVRSMNNLHGRLGFFESGSNISRIRWIELLAQLSQITWEDEAHKTNYLWFTILERPDFVHS
mmetsp:Transcript_12537/g.25962  ORF Transcript_12537/g.25962 Transcript_12537/m.25962 type:complete len:434 (-) Transcript_12537:481-1782(-)